MRVAAVWFPDWPIQAVAQPGPVLIARNHAVLVCDSAARRVGIRRGMRLRQAQAICPEIKVVEANPDRDGAAFAEIAVGLDAVASSVEVLRPGLAIVDAGAALRYHGPEALEMLADATAHAGFDSTLGVADEIATAIIAARHRGVGAVVPEGGSRDFLTAQPVGVLAEEAALGFSAEFVAQLQKLGVRRLGDVAELPFKQVVTRFGQQGKRAHEVAHARADRRVSPEMARPDLSVSSEQSIERVDAAAFVARQLAAQLHVRLAEAEVVCVRLRVVAELATGETVARVWRTHEALTEQATADRVRWQLDGWLTAARSSGKDGAAIVRLVLEPVEVARPQADGLWGGDTSQEQVKRVISRVQSQLGIDRVLQPRAAGGRGVAERIEYVPYGEQRDATPQGSWPGRIPAPLPARLGGGPNHPAARIRLIDAAARDVIVTAEALLSSVPVALGWGAHRYRVIGWAGPWPVDTQWWTEKPQHAARLQIVGQAEREQRQRAWLLVWSEGRWRVEATY